MPASNLPPLFDTHAHYNLEPLWPNWQTHWQKAQAHGVVGSIVVGTNLTTCARALEINSLEPKLKVALGIHPSEWTQEATLVEANISKLEELVSGADTSALAAIGEIGLDYYWLNKGNHSEAQKKQIKRIQQQAFRAQLELAAHANLPVILHVRDQDELETPTSGNAYWDTYEIIKERPPAKFVLHCFSGPTAYLEKMIDLGAFIGVDGNITYPSAHSLREKIKLVPSEKILLETDAPFLAPQKFRGQVCEPYMIEETARALSSIKGKTPPRNWPFD